MTTTASTIPNAESAEHLEGGHWAVVAGVRKWVADPPPPATRDQLLKNAAASPRKSTRNLGERIKTQLDKLAKTLLEEKRAAERAAAEAEADKERRERIAEIEAELRKLKGKPAKRTYTRQTGHYPCDQCDRVFDTPQGLRLHERRAHEGFNPHAVHGARSAQEHAS